MLHESKEQEKVRINNSEVCFYNLDKKYNLSQDLFVNIKDADILLLPHENFKGFKNCFPEQTYQFYAFLKKEAAKSDLLVDIVSSDEEYKELELHSDVINISEILIQWILFPVVTGMISSFLYEIAKKRKKKINAFIKINVEKKGKTKIINYEGDIENFEKAMKSVKEDIFDE